MDNAIAPIKSSVVVDTRYTQDLIPVLDTSKFEHMQRVAMVMAEMSMLPDSLCRHENGEPLPSKTVIANCFRIVNQAVRWGLDPFAVVDCASIVRGRMQWEGKLIAAVLDAKLGVDLEYRFNDAKGEDLGVTVIGTKPGQKEPRTVFGTVKMWSTGSKGPWGNPMNWPRQLRYRGAREWARAHAPAVILGVYADDEMSDVIERESVVAQRIMRMRDVSPVLPKNFAAPTSPQLAAAAVPDIPDADPPSPAPSAGAPPPSPSTASQAGDPGHPPSSIVERPECPSKAPSVQSVANEVHQNAVIDATRRARDFIRSAANRRMLETARAMHPDADWGMLDADYRARLAQLGATPQTTQGPQ